MKKHLYFLLLSLLFASFSLLAAPSRVDSADASSHITPESKRASLQGAGGLGGGASRDAAPLQNQWSRPSSACTQASTQLQQKAKQRASQVQRPDRLKDLKHDFKRSAHDE